MPFTRAWLGLPPRFWTFVSLSLALTLRQWSATVAYIVLMAGITSLACVVPTRRALGIEPTEALRTE